MTLVRDPLAGGGGTNSIFSVGTATTVATGIKYTVPAGKVTKVLVTFVATANNGTMTVGSCTLSPATANANAGFNCEIWISAGQTINVTGAGAAPSIISWVTYNL